MSRSPELAEVLRSFIESALREVHVSLPGRIESYDAATQTADVKPLIQRRDEAGGASVALPVICGVPVAFPRAGGYRITFPVAKGDTVHLVFCERSLDSWLANGGDSDPKEMRTHHLSDAVAYVGLHDNRNAISSAPTDALAIGKDDGSVEVQIKDSEVIVTASSKIVVKAPSVEIGPEALEIKLGPSAALGVARQTDTVQAGPFAGTITRGSLLVKAGG